MSERNPFIKYTEGEPEPELIVNEAGFVDHSQIDWPVCNAGQVIRMLTKIGDQLAMLHPGSPDLFTQLIPEASRLGKKLPASTVNGDCYRLLQSFVMQAAEMVEHWRQAERFVGPSEPVRSATVHRPTHRRAKRQPSVAVDALQRRIDGEHREEINDVLAAM